MALSCAVFVPEPEGDWFSLILAAEAPTQCGAEPGANLSWISSVGAVDVLLGGTIPAGKDFESLPESLATSPASASVFSLSVTSRMGVSGLGWLCCIALPDRKPRVFGAERAVRGWRWASASFAVVEGEENARARQDVSQARCDIYDLYVLLYTGMCWNMACAPDRGP